MESKAEHGQAGSKEFIVLMAAMMSIVAISIDAMLPALGIIGQDLQVAHINHTQYIISSIFAGMAIGQLICGPLSDAIGRKNILYCSLALYLAGTIACAMADSIAVMLAGRFIQGLGVAGPYISCMSIVRDKFSGRAMARVMSLVMMIFIMVPAIAPALGQGILFAASWHAIFIFYIFYALAILIWITFRLEETLPPQKRIPFKASAIANGFRMVIGNRTTLSYMVCAGLIFGSLIGYLNSCQQIFQNQFGVGDKFALYFGMLALVFGVSSLANARLVEKHGMRYLCMRATLAIIAASAIFVGLHFVTTVTLPMFLLYAAAVFFAFGLLFGNLNALAMEPMGAIAGIAAAIIGSTSSILSMVLGTAIGQLYNNSLLPIGAGFLVLATVALAIMLFEQRLHAKSLLPGAAE